MNTKWRIIALVAALCLVEITSYWKLSHWLFWTNEPLLGYTTALAFIGLLLSSIVALGSDIPESTRKQFYLAGIWLFFVQGLANVLVAFQQSLTGLPAEVVTGFFGVSHEFALKSMAAIQGATLSVVSVVFWSVIGRLLQELGEERQVKQQELKDLERLFKEVN